MQHKQIRKYRNHKNEIQSFEQLQSGKTFRLFIIFETFKCFELCLKTAQTHSPHHIGNNSLLENQLLKYNLRIQFFPNRHCDDSPDNASQPELTVLIPGMNHRASAITLATIMWFISKNSCTELMPD